MAFSQFSLFPAVTLRHMSIVVGFAGGLADQQIRSRMVITEVVI
jgi:hypothetical protein